MVMIFSLLILLNLYATLPELVDCALLEGNTQTGRVVEVATRMMPTTDRWGGSGEAFIKVSRFQVPRMAKQGDTARLSCYYELSRERLYAMKLFKDEQEFYRYRPSVPPEDQRLNFTIEGVVVDLRRSNANDVYLLNLTKSSSGTYKCQVSVENTFRSVSAERNMEVKPRNTQLPLNPNALSYQTGAGSGSGPGTGTGSNRQQQQRHTTVQRKHPTTSSAAGFLQQTSGDATQQQVEASIAANPAGNSSISDRLHLSSLQIIQRLFILTLLTCTLFHSQHTLSSH